MRELYAPLRTPYKIKSLMLEKNTDALDYLQVKIELHHQIIEKISGFIPMLEKYHHDNPHHTIRFYQRKINIMKSGVLNLSKKINTLENYLKSNPHSATLNILQTASQVRVFESILKYLGDNLSHQIYFANPASIDRNVIEGDSLLKQLSDIRTFIFNAQKDLLEATPQQFSLYFSINFIS
jgi:hypothetical protein